MHGVGDYFVAKAFRILGLPPFIAVEEQREPDPDFPTVKFPNPEEKGTGDEPKNITLADPRVL